MLGELEWPSLEASRDLSSLLLFHKIYFGAVFIERNRHFFNFKKKIFPSQQSIWNPYGTHTEPIFGVQLGSIWAWVPYIPYGLSHVNTVG